jgi:DNA-binding transcriptional regulator YiaG
VNKPIPQILQDAVSDLEARASFLTNRRFGGEVRQLRDSLGLTQEAFSERFGLVLGNVRNWEQPSRNTQPDSSARLLIEMIKADPERVAKIVERVREERKYGRKIG